MARQCATCIHPKVEEIDRLLVRGESIPGIMKKIATDADETIPLTYESLANHKKAHLPDKLIRATERALVREDRDFFGEMEKIAQRTNDMLDKAEESGKGALFIAAIREARENQKLLMQMHAATIAAQGPAGGNSEGEDPAVTERAWEKAKQEFPQAYMDKAFHVLWRVSQFKANPEMKPGDEGEDGSLPRFADGTPTVVQGVKSPSRAKAKESTPQDRADFLAGKNRDHSQAEANSQDESKPMARTKPSPSEKEPNDEDTSIRDVPAENELAVAPTGEVLVNGRSRSMDSRWKDGDGNPLSPEEIKRRGLG